RGKAGGHGGIDGVPAPPEDIQPHPGGDKVTGYHHAPTTNRIGVTGPDLRDEKPDDKAKGEYAPNLHG
ncbi:unnamed protein product, partial [marine sediment metagenome]